MNDANGRSLTLRSLVTILFRPRATFRRLLDSGAPRIVIPLVALAIVAGFVQDFSRSGFEAAVATSAITRPALIAINVAGLIVLTLIGVLLFYGIAWLVAVVGRFYGGHGDARTVRAALAWGAVPTVWALLYYVPAAFFFASGDVHLRVGEGGSFAFDPGILAAGCGATLVMVLVRFAIFFWSLAVTIAAVGEAHGFSSWAALGTLATIAVVPLVVAAAAALAIFF